MTATASEAVPERRAFSAAELATAWGKSERTVQLMLARGDLPSFKVGRCRMVLVRDVEAYETNRVKERQRP